jgi:sensor domain CHASE-containing protein
MTELQPLVSLLVPVAAVIVWLIRLEGRINVHQALHDRLAADVAYIRSRIDSALNGHLKDHE